MRLPTFLSMLIPFIVQGNVNNEHNNRIKGTDELHHFHSVRKGVQIESTKLWISRGLLTLITVGHKQNLVFLQ